MENSIFEEKNSIDEAWVGMSKNTKYIAQPLLNEQASVDSLSGKRVYTGIGRCAAQGTGGRVWFVHSAIYGGIIRKWESEVLGKHDENKIWNYKYKPMTTAV